MSEEQNTENMPQPGDVYDVPVEGSLGLLALGSVGLKAWRQKKREAMVQGKLQNEQEDTDELNEEKTEE